MIDRQYSDDLIALIGLIKDAFKDVKLHQGVSWLQAAEIDKYSSKEEQAKARKKDRLQDWSEIEPSIFLLPELQTNVVHLDMNGLLFYLAPLMLVGINESQIFLKGEETSESMVHDTLVFKLHADDEFVSDLKSRLNKHQIKAISSYLRYCMTEADEFFFLSDEAKEEVSILWLD